MTLAAAIIRPDGCFLVTDILQTRKHSKEGEELDHFDYRIIDKPEEILDEYTWRSLLKPIQKAYIIAENFCIGVSGSTIFSKETVKQLSDRFYDTVVNLQDLKN